MSVNVKPLHDRVIVKPAEKAEKTAGGIIIPDTAQEKPQKGEVVAVGNGTKDFPMTVKVGDKVMMPFAGSAQKVILADEEYVLFREQELLMIIK